MVKAVQDPLAPPAAAAHQPDRIRQSFSVPYQYDVLFTWDALLPDNPSLVETLVAPEPNRVHRAFVVMDQGFDAAWPEARRWFDRYFGHHANRIALATAPVSVVAGEAAKNDPALIHHLHTLFQQHHLDRHSYVVVIGGGGVQDAAGYAAATAHRGIRTVRMPTTVLSQNDSGVGVKNGINAFGAKNFVGTFVPPHAVINDFRFLERLPRRDRIAGMAEAVKVALIRDASFFEWLEAHAQELADGDAGALAILIRRCAALHLRHIATGGDPFERGSARPLDFGHWAAHKLETLTAHEVCHGEAVAIGMLLDSRYSVEAGLLAEAELDRIAALVARLGLPGWHQALDTRTPAGQRRALLQGLDDFREHLGGALTVTLLEGIGKAIEVHEMREPLIERALDWMRTRDGRP